MSVHDPRILVCGRENCHREHKERKKEEGNVPIFYVFFVFSVAIAVWA